VLAANSPSHQQVLAVILLEQNQLSLLRVHLLSVLRVRVHLLSVLRVHAPFLLR
jgi:hypothetical protein